MTDETPSIPAGTTAERLATRGPIAVASRAATLGALAASANGEPFDLVIIGGGISGAGVAREAALAGYRVALIERDDFASGTSSRSSRLVHGGVRYLEHGHLSLVFESSRERRLLLQLAPHLVRPLAFTWPVYRGARVPLWQVRAALLMYDALSLFRNVQTHDALDAEGVLGFEPALARDDLRGGARYWDAATDDTRLTLATAIAARDAGAMIANHLEIVRGVHVTTPQRRLVGVVARNRIDGSELEVRARVVVNATGPWSDATSAITGEPRKAQVFGSVGSHIAVPRQRIGNNDAITLVSPLDGRVMFVLPAGAHAIIGTTERPMRGEPDEVRATSSEVQYLLRNVNACFPHSKLTNDDVISAWAGIRPLAAVRAGESSANAASREHAIAHRADGLVSITGGKLTTFRAMAADVLEHALIEVRKSGSAVAPRSEPQESESTPLHGGEFSSREALVREATDTVHDGAVGERLVLAYGTNWRNVWSYAQRDPSLRKRLVQDLPYLVAEVPHAIERELACNLADILIRRTHVAFETRDHGRGVARRIAPLVSALLGWSSEREAEELAGYEREVTRIFSVDA